MSDGSDEEFTFGGENPPLSSIGDTAPAATTATAPVVKENKGAAAAAAAAASSSDDEPIWPSRGRKKKRASAAAAARVEREADDRSDDDDANDNDGDAASPPKKQKKKTNAVETEVQDVEGKKKVKAEGPAAAKKKKRKTPPSAIASPVGSSGGKRVKREEEEEGEGDTATTSTTPIKGGRVPAVRRALKALDKTERLQSALQSFQWWNAPEPPAGCQWVTMEHAGVSFPDPYQPHGVPLHYQNRPVVLSSAEEEAATFLAAMDPDGMHLGNPATATIFVKNFFADFCATLRGPNRLLIKKFTDCDFGPMRQHLAEQKMIRRAVTDAERTAARNDRSTILHQYGYALVDGHVERVGNYNMEPPGAFRGRGAHPKMGMLKGRVLPEQVSLNLSEGAAVPACRNPPGHAWADVRHDPRGQWLATWKENINHQVGGGNTARGSEGGMACVCNM